MRIIDSQRCNGLDLRVTRWRAIISATSGSSYSPATSPPPDLPVLLLHVLLTPWPCDRLSRSPRRARHRPRLLGSPPHPIAVPINSELLESSHPSRLDTGPDERSRQGGSHVHQVIGRSGGTQLYSGSVATATPQAFTRPPHRWRRRLRSRHPIRGAVHCTPAHIHQVGAGFAVTELLPLVRLRCTF